MSHVVLKVAVAGLLLAFAASAAQAAKPQTVKHHMKMAEKRQFATSPRTMAQADAALVSLPSGVLAQPIPTELWNYIAVQKDAQGNLRQVETSSPAAPTGTFKGLDNE